MKLPFTIMKASLKMSVQYYWKDIREIVLYLQAVCSNLCMCDKMAKLSLAYTGNDFTKSSTSKVTHVRI